MVAADERDRAATVKPHPLGIGQTCEILEIFALLNIHNIWQSLGLNWL